MREAEGRKQKTELATVVDMLSEMRGERKDREQNYKRRREDPREGDDYCREDRNRDERRDVMKCYKCDKEGHRKAECPEENRGRTSDLCKFCRKPGHTVEECEARKNHVCRDCGGKGHSAMWCKERDCKECGNKHSLLNGCRH